MPRGARHVKVKIRLTLFDLNSFKPHSVVSRPTIKIDARLLGILDVGVGSSLRGPSADEAAAPNVVGGPTANVESSANEVDHFTLRRLV